MKSLFVGIALCTIIGMIPMNRTKAAELHRNATSANELETDSVSAARDLFVQSLKATGRDRLLGLRKSFEQLELAAAENDQLPPALTMWSRLLLSVGDQRLARHALQQATATHAESPDAYVLLGNLAVSNGQLAQASLCYGEASRLLASWDENHPRRSPLLAQVAAGRASVAQARSRLLAATAERELLDQYEATALASLQEWASLDGENAGAHQRLGEALIAAGNVDEAIVAFDNARRLDPELPITEFRLAKALLQQGDRTQALSQINQALATSSNDSQVRLGAAELLLSLGETESAQQQIAAVLEMEPDSTAAKLWLAQTKRFRGDWQAAADILQSLSTDNPANFEVANLLALTLSEIDSPAARQRALALASVTAQRFDQLDSVSGRRARISLVWTAFVSGQTEAAKKSFTELLKTGISSKQVSGDEGYYASRLLVEFGRPELAATLLTSMLQRVEAFPKRGACEELRKQLQ